jgi:hypothetical protein
MTEQEITDAVVRLRAEIKALLNRSPKGFTVWNHETLDKFRAAAKVAKSQAYSTRTTHMKLDMAHRALVAFYH